MAAKRGKKCIRDWERIELDYRAGIKTLREIGETNNISISGICKRATRDGWTRDLKAKIMNRADSIVSGRGVGRPMEFGNPSEDDERVTIETNAAVIANIKLAHRLDIPRARNIAMKLLAELEAETNEEVLHHLNQLGSLMLSPDDETGRDRMNELYQKVISLPGRTQTLKNLSEALKTLIGLERQAFNMDLSPEEAFERPKLVVEFVGKSDVD